MKCGKSLQNFQIKMGFAQGGSSISILCKSVREKVSKKQNKMWAFMQGCYGNNLSREMSYQTPL
jgi:hypothetical protein